MYEVLNIDIVTPLIGQYLSNKNKNATIAKLKKFSQLKQSEELTTAVSRENMQLR